MKIAVVLILLALACTPVIATTYSTDVKPILDGNCIECHDGVNQEPDLTSYPFRSSSSSDQPTIVQDILSKVQGTPALMPPGNRPKLSPAQVTTIQQWLSGGLAE